ncbi:MAG: serine/threonine protein kinase [Chloracidobacterium sp.]|nr:serine/threonine protein kinase [Chloracidobacterium sp.]
MTDWQKVDEGIAAVIEIGTVLRSAWLDKFCAGDDDLKSEIESLLAFEGDAASFLELPFGPHAAALLDSDSNGCAGKAFGNYDVIREIGEGGMGTVFLARRNDGEFDRLVALKIIRQSIVGSRMIESFRRERQILASLNHANIALLLDGGVSQTGEPFLAMEYIDGEPISDFVRNNNLSVSERVRLFVKVCSAVAYAHRNLVVHRDIKPGNILVTAAGEPKLLDFGLAKLTRDDLSGDTAETQTAFRALTPAYASPEQLRGDAINTASDVYSLGVVFYELLTGSRPFNFDGKSLDEIIKTVTAIEPPLPSANSPSSGPDPQLKGDLDNIALMALRHEPERRYESVEQLVGDIEKYLKGLPVSARPNTVRYRAGKYINRHKVAVLAASLILLSLIGGIVVSLWQVQIAQREKEKAQSVSAFLNETLKYSNPFLNSVRKIGHETTVNEVLDEAARKLENGQFDSSPEIKAELESTVASIYFGQGKYQPAYEHLEQHITLVKNLYGENDPKVIEASLMWASLLFYRGETDKAEETFRQYLPLLQNESQKGNITADSVAGNINGFAAVCRTNGKSREAETLFRKILDLTPQLSERGRSAVATARSTLASTIADQGRFDEALGTARDAVDEYRQRSETDSPNYGFSLTVLGGFLTDKGDYDEADKDLKDAETIFRGLLSPSTLWLGDNLRNQSISLYEQGKYTEAMDKAEEALKIYNESFGKHYDNYPTTLIVKGLILTKTGQLQEGEKILREAVQLRTESLPNEHFWVALADRALGENLMIQKRFAEAEPLLKASYESLRLSQGKQNPRTVLARVSLDKLYEIQHR